MFKKTPGAWLQAPGFNELSLERNNYSEMYKWIMIGYFITYVLTGSILLFGPEYWGIPKDILVSPEENFFLPFLLFQSALVFLAGSQSKDERFQIITMVFMLFLSIFIGIREFTGFIQGNVKPLVWLVAGQGFLALAFLIQAILIPTKKYQSSSNRD